MLPGVQPGPFLTNDTAGIHRQDRHVSFITIGKNVDSAIILCSLIARSFSAHLSICARTTTCGSLRPRTGGSSTQARPRRGAASRLRVRSAIRALAGACSPAAGAGCRAIVRRAALRASVRLGQPAHMACGPAPGPPKCLRWTATQSRRARCSPPEARRGLAPRRDSASPANPDCGQSRRGNSANRAPRTRARQPLLGGRTWGLRRECSEKARARLGERRPLGGSSWSSGPAQDTGGSGRDVRTIELRYLYYDCL